MVWCAYGTGLWIGGRATGNEGRCATYVARLAMTEKEVWQAPRKCALLCLTTRTLVMMGMKQHKFSAQKKEAREAPLFRIKLCTA